MAAPNNGQERSALVIDDNSIARMILEDELAEAGLFVYLASTSADGIGIARDKIPSIIILDPSVSGFDGLRVISELKASERTRDIPVVAVMSTDSRIPPHNGLKDFAIRIFHKPFATGKLGSFVGNYLHTKEERKSSRILLVDDSSTIRAVTKYLLEKQGHSVVTAEDGVKGWEAINRLASDIDMVITDINMPNMDGRQLVGLIREDRRFRLIPVVVSTTISEKESIKLLLNMGADDYIIKPFSSEEFIARIQSHLRVKTLYGELVTATERLARFNETLELRVTERTEALLESNLDVIYSLATAAEAKDEITGNHVYRIQSFSEALALKMRLGDKTSAEIGYSSIMHDVGKISIPDEILKKPGKLTAEEFAVMKTHTTNAARILPGKPFYAMARIVARSHHEKWDGSGYPDGLKGEDIPLPARIVAIADVFDALVTVRPYKEAWPMSRAIEEMIKSAGRHFDPDITDMWVKLYHEGALEEIVKRLGRLPTLL
jgi:putative two-component system response regulator